MSSYFSNDMPHSCPAVTSRASSLKRFSVASLPSWITTLSRIKRTFAPRSTLPSVTRQPAILPTFETAKISRISALPSMVSRKVGGSARVLVRANVKAYYRGTSGGGECYVGFGNAADAGEQDAGSDFVGPEFL